MKKLLLAGVSLAAIGLSNAAQARISALRRRSLQELQLPRRLSRHRLPQRFINYYGSSGDTRLRRPIRRRRRHAARDRGAADAAEHAAMPFTEWPYGGTTNLGVTRPNSIDSPLMNAMSNTRSVSDERCHIQVYGWLDPAATSLQHRARRQCPAAYSYNPNTCSSTRR